MLARPDEPLEIAFANNLRWLLRFYRRKLPRHLVQLGTFDRGHRFRDVEAEIGRWLEAGDLVMDKAGDFRLSKAGAARVAQLLDVDRSAA